MMTSYVLIFALVAVLAAYFSYNPYDLGKVKGMRVIVTGASTGIGEQLAYVYAQHGAHVVAVARSEDKLKRVVEKCKELGAPTANYISADMSKTEDKYFNEVIFKGVKLLGGSLDTLVLNHVGNTGNYRQEGWYKEHDMQTIASMFFTNTFSYFSLAQQAFPELEKTNGKVIVVGSAAGKLGLPNVAPYSASKHALFGYFDSLRYDIAKSGSNVTITTCMIGSINTDNAREATKQSKIPDFMWASAQTCAEEIIRGGESRIREVYFPFMQTYPLFLLRSFPALTEFIVQNTGFD